MSTADYVKTALATLATVVLLVVMMRALGKEFFTSLTNQVDLKVEILRRLSHRR